MNLLIWLIPCAYLLDSLIVIFTRLDDFLLLGNTILDKDHLLVVIILRLFLLLLLFFFVFMLFILLVHDLIFNLRTL